MPDIVYISKEIEWDAGHRVPGHQSKCRHPHGHRYRLRVTCVGSIIETPGAPDEGMLVDFGNLKTIMTDKVHDVLDHGFIVAPNDVMMNQIAGTYPDFHWVFFPYVPTAENIARWCWEQLYVPIMNNFGRNLWLHEIAIWETPTSVAYFRGERTE